MKHRKIKARAWFTSFMAALISGYSVRGPTIRSYLSALARSSWYPADCSQNRERGAIGRIVTPVVALGLGTRNLGVVRKATLNGYLRVVGAHLRRPSTKGS